MSEFYSHKEYDFHSQTWAAHQDTNQFMHFGTGNGLLTFDGKDWNRLHIGESGRGISLYLSQNNTFFVSGEYDFGYISNDSLSKLSYFSISDQYYDKEELVNTHFSTFEFNEAVYFGGWQGLDIYKADSLYKYPLANILFPNAFLFDDKVFISNEFGIHEFRNESYRLIPASTQFEGSRNVFALPISQDRMLLGYIEKGLFFFDGYNFSKFKTKADQYLIDSQIYDATMVNDSTIAIATIRGGLVLLDISGNIKYIYNSNTGFDQQGIFDTYVDHEETLWLGLWGGIEKVQINTPIKKYSINENIDFEILDAIYLRDEIYIKGVNELKKSSLLEFENSLTFNSLSSSLDITGSSDFIRINNQMYLTNREGILKLNRARSFESVYAGEVLSLTDNYDEPEKLSFIDKKGLMVQDGSEFIRKSQFEPIGTINESVVFNEALYLISNNETMYRFYEDELMLIPIDNNTDYKTYYNHMDVIDGLLYVGTEGAEENGGMYFYNSISRKLEKVEKRGLTDQHLNTKQVLAFDECKNGDVWVQNDKQIKRLKKEDGNWVIQTSPFQSIGEYDAIFSIQCEEDGIWFGGVNGLYHLTNPDWEYTHDFKTNITDIFVNRDSVIYSGYGEPDKPIVLSYNDNEVRFGFAASSYIDTERNSYSYKLEGFDANWSPWSLETQKDYTNIPEGDYLFKVRSKNVYEKEGKEDQIAFTVLPPWYRSWWAYLIYVISVSAIMYTGYKIRVNQLLKVERMRTKIASDLHDEVSATLTGISYFAEAIKRNMSKDKANHFIELISESAGDAKEKITDIVWSINPENDDWELFLSKCRRFASDLLESKNLEYNLKITDHIPGKLSMDTRQHLWMIFKEMITNAARHSGATRLDVILDVEGDVLKIIVQDNGKGFDTENTIVGNGLQNIRKRANMINASLLLTSEEDFGTRWRMELKL